MTRPALTAGWQTRLRPRREALPRGFTLLSIRRPTELLGGEHASLRSEIVAVSDAAFGRSTVASWAQKYRPEYLGTPTRSHLLADPDRELVGWNGYRARTISGDRIVDFASTGLYCAARAPG